MVDWAAVSHAFMPVGLRDRAIAVHVETDRETYRPGQSVGVRVTFRNRLPVPVKLRTCSPVRWRWAIDGIPEASRIERPEPDGRGALAFRRRERKTFVRQWHQSIRDSDRGWQPVDPGDHHVSAWINVDDPTGRGLSAETMIQIGNG